MNKLLLFLFPISAFASSYMAVEKLNTTSVYAEKPVCEQIEKTPCYDIIGCHPDECSLNKATGKMQPDFAKIQAKAAKAEQDEQKEQDKKTQHAQDALALKKCLNGAMSTAEVNECVKIMVRRLFPDVN